MSAPNTPPTDFKVVKKNIFEGTDGNKYDLKYNKTTGDYTISFADTVIMKNNTWTKAALDDPKLFKDKDSTQPTEVLKQIEALSKQEVIKASKVSGGKTHPSVTTEGFSVEGTEPTSQSNPLLDFIQTAVGFAIPSIELPKIEEYGGDDLKALFANKPLRYPNDISKQQDRLLITQYEYKSPYNEVFRGIYTAGNLKYGIQRQSALRDLIGVVTLPIPNNVSDRNIAGWGNGDVMDTLAIHAAGDMIRAGGAAITGSIAQTLGGNMNGFAGGLLKNLSPQLIYTLLEMKTISNPLLGALIQSLILRNIGFTDVTPQTILSRGYGVIPNSNLELLFSGPTLRGFSFGYLMTPRSEQEASMCRDILRFFKQGMAPKKKETSSTGYGEASFFLATPNVFKLQYVTGTSDTIIKGLNRFKICALTDMSVNYAQDQWMAYDEGQPARMVLTLSFKELEPVYESDYKSNRSTEIKGDYKDQDPVNVGDVGY